MPFDGTETTPALRRKILIEALRAPLVNWEWDFSIVRNECGTAGCAIGYMETLWSDANFKKNTYGGINFNEIGDFLGLSYEQARKTFDTHSYRIAPEKVTQTMVADRLEALDIS